MFGRAVQEMLYKNATSSEDLPWHRDEPPRLLVEAVSQRKATGRALDLGCGTGAYAVYLAKLGYEVTALDFIAKALDMAQARAVAAGVSVHWIHGDVLTWRSDGRYDLVLDSG